MSSEFGVRSSEFGIRNYFGMQDGRSLVKDERGNVKQRARLRLATRYGTRAGAIGCQRSRYGNSSRVVAPFARSTFCHSSIPRRSAFQPSSALRTPNSELIPNSEFRIPNCGVIP